MPLPRDATDEGNSMTPCPIYDGLLHCSSGALSLASEINAGGVADFKELHDTSKHKDMASTGYSTIPSFHPCSQVRRELEFRIPHVRLGHLSSPHQKPVSLMHHKRVRKEHATDLFLSSMPLALGPHEAPHEATYEATNRPVRAKHIA